MLLIPQMLSTCLQGIQNTCLKSSKADNSAIHYLFAKTLCFNDSKPEPLHLDNLKEDRKVKILHLTTAIMHPTSNKRGRLKAFNIQVCTAVLAHPLHSFSQTQQPTWGFQQIPVEHGFI